MNKNKLKNEIIKIVQGIKEKFKKFNIFKLNISKQEKNKKKDKKETKNGQEQEQDKEIQENEQEREIKEKTQESPTGKKSKKKKKSKYRFLKNFITKTLFVIAVGWFTLTYVFQLYRATGNAMSPFVRDGDLCVFYKLEDAYANDVVVYQTEDGEIHVGRIIGTPSQVVDFPEEGGFELNGYQPAEEIMVETYKSENSIIEYPLELGDDEYFIMNDYRSLTDDSREFGAIKKSQIKGKLLIMLRRRGF